MSARTMACLVLACDCCGEDIDGGSEYTPHFADAADARDQLVSFAEIWTNGTADICEPCKYDEHEFVPDKFGNEECDRCGIEKDEHEAPTGRPCPNRRKPPRGPALPHTHDPDGDGTDDCAACDVADDAREVRKADR